MKKSSLHLSLDEAEARRADFRVQLTAQDRDSLQLSISDHRVHLINLSASGCAFIYEGDHLSAETLLWAKLQFELDTEQQALDFALQLLEQRDNEYRCRFVELGERGVNTICRLVNNLQRRHIRKALGKA
ncbi:PilZ domain-containing protein [Pokkaliibacter sp. CJK22405]|uniref:PilZ domain-containing protein n=1 Tax=Pokkaliibacter sp. CJK22405 TaxID=3384615 RepID=UPI003984B7F5